MKTKDIKFVWRRFIEANVAVGFDITNYLFNRPALKNLKIDVIVDMIRAYETESAPDGSDKWNEWNNDNEDLINFKNQYINN